MVKSKAWEWEKITKEDELYWLEPSIVAYYLINRWQKDKKKTFLDLGCGLGRHTILFAENNFETWGFDLSEESIKKTEKLAKEKNLNINLLVGDMLNLPYKDNSFDAILCFNVISHTDTLGIKKIISELKRILKVNGECYLTLCSKNTWGFKNTSWPMIDENTKKRMEEGPEYGIPHFYADYDLILELFKDFKIEKLFQVEDFKPNKDGQVFSSFHYHILIKKEK